MDQHSRSGEETWAKGQCDKRLQIGNKGPDLQGMPAGPTGPEAKGGPGAEGQTRLGGARCRWDSQLPGGLPESPGRGVRGSASSLTQHAPLSLSQPPWGWVFAS